VGGAGRGKKNAAVAQGLKRKEVKNRSRKVIGRGGADSDDDVGARNRSKVRNELDAGYAAALGAKSDSDEDEGEEEADEETEDASGSSEEASDNSSSSDDEPVSTMAPKKQQQKHKRQYYAATENFKGQARAEAMLDEDAAYRAAQAAAKEDTSRSIDALLATARALVMSFAAARGVPPPQPAASASPGGEQQPAVIHMGFIGFPNVGKSTILNAVCGVKRVSVSSTPGHTKHVQTIVLPEDHVVLLDCPGLCFPAVGVPRPLQAVLGTHQIAQTRDPQSGVAYIARHLPLERVYGLRKIDADGSADDNVWSAVDLCESFAVKKGYRIRNAKGRPDVHRAAISILQDAYEGRLVLYFAAPPLESGWAARFARGGFAPIPEEVLEPTDATPAEHDM
jgi:ribosome biogenesis GTPase A